MSRWVSWYIVNTDTSAYYNLYVLLMLAIGNAYRICKFNQFWAIPIVNECVGDNVQDFKSGVSVWFSK